MTSEQQAFIDAWWMQSGHNLSHKQAVDAGFQQGFKYALGGESRSIEELKFLRRKLKNGEYDGADIMAAWLAIDELIAIKERAF